MNALMRLSWAASPAGGGPSTNAPTPSAVACTKARSSAASESAIGTRCLGPSSAVSLVPAAITARQSAPGCRRGSISAARRSVSCTEVSPRIPRLYAVIGLPEALHSATTRPTQPIPAGSPTPATNESPKNITRRSITGRRENGASSAGTLTESETGGKSARRSFYGLGSRKQHGPVWWRRGARGDRARRARARFWIPGGLGREGLPAQT